MQGPPISPRTPDGPPPEHPRPALFSVPPVVWAPARAAGSGRSSVQARTLAGAAGSGRSSEQARALAGAAGSGRSSVQARALAWAATSGRSSVQARALAGAAGSGRSSVQARALARAAGSGRSSEQARPSPGAQGEISERAKKAAAPQASASAGLSTTTSSTSPPKPPQQQQQQQLDEDGESTAGEDDATVGDGSAGASASRALSPGDAPGVQQGASEQASEAAAPQMARKPPPQPPPLQPPQQRQQRQQRHPLDVVVGTNTETIYTVMCEVQHNHRPAFTPDSPYVKYRRYLVDWIAETSEDLKLDITTVHVAALYLDRVLLKAHDASSGRCLIPRHLWQLVAMVCLRTAAKFEERDRDVTGDANGKLCLAGGRRVDAVEAFTRHLGDAAQSVTPEQIREWEVFLLEQLGWHLSSVTPVHCLAYFQGRGVVFQDDSWNGRPVINKIPRYVEKYNNFFSNLCLQDYFYTQYSPTHLAAAILYSSRHAISLEPPWRPELETLTGHSKEDVELVFTHIWNFYDETFPQHARRTPPPKGAVLVQGGSECSVCLEMIENRFRTRCGHPLCDGCRKRWLGLGKVSCPICRQDLLG